MEHERIGAPDTGTPPLLRVVVRFGADERPSPLASAASVLASALGAELRGVFIRDEALRNLAALPFASAIRLAGGSVTRLDMRLIEEAWSASESACRAALAAAAARERAAWSFESLAGDVESSIRHHVGARDLLALTLHSPGPDARDTIELARRLASQAGAVLLLASNLQSIPTGPVLAIDDGDRIGERTVSLGGRIATRLGRTLSILAIGRDAAETVKARARADAPPAGSTVTVVQRGSTDAAIDALRRTKPGFVVGDVEGEPFGHGDAGASIIGVLESPLVLLGSGSRELEPGRPGQ